MNSLSKRERFQGARLAGSDLQKMIDLADKGIVPDSWAKGAQKQIDDTYKKLRAKDLNPLTAIHDNDSY